MPKKKTRLIIRRSGYYVNSIPNIPGARQKWMENNLPRSNPKGKLRKDGLRAERSIAASMRICFITFTPATVDEVKDAPIYVPSLSKQFGLVTK